MAKPDKLIATEQQAAGGTFTSRLLEILIPQVSGKAFTDQGFGDGPQNAPVPKPFLVSAGLSPCPYSQKSVKVALNLRESPGRLLEMPSAAQPCEVALQGLPPQRVQTWQTCSQKGHRPQQEATSFKRQRQSASNFAKRAATVCAAVAAPAPVSSRPHQHAADDIQLRPEGDESQLPAYDPAQGKVHLAVVGAGPSGLSVAERVAAAGFRVCIIDPSPLAPWTNNYGVWKDEFDAMGLDDCLSTVWNQAHVFLDNTAEGKK